MGNKQGKKEKEITRKIVVVGDGEVGKTSLIVRYTDDEFDEFTPQAQIPTALDIKTKKIVVNGKTVELLIYDTGGQETFEHMRRINYPKSDGVLVCYSICDKTSLTNAKAMWIPEMKKMCPGVPIVLVGTKRDLRDEADRIDGFIRELEGRKLKKKAKLLDFKETSSLLGEGVEDVFDILIKKVSKMKSKLKTSEDA